MTERIVCTSIHGRYLVAPPLVAGPAPLLAGFHGYGEDAETQLERLRSIPESGQFICVSVQGLHQFYQRRTERVVASWMTRQQRALSIADNLRYVAACMESIQSEWPALPGAVFTGFSQGVAMAFRAAVHANGPVSVIANAGDVPPELTAAELGRISAVLVARGEADAWYTNEKLVRDEERLQPASVAVETLEFAGGHEWPAELTVRASLFLKAHLHRLGGSAH